MNGGSGQALSKGKQLVWATAREDVTLKPLLMGDPYSLWRKTALCQETISSQPTIFKYLDASILF